MSVRFRICLAAWMAIVAFSLFSSTSNAEVFQFEDGWTMEITPTWKLPDDTTAVQPAAGDSGISIQPGDTAVPPPADSAAAGKEAVRPGPASVGTRYERIYKSIPFNRAEYNANPSYRHDSAMEILTGNPRHQTIVRHDTARRTPIRRTAPVLPYRYNNPYRGLNYYFYFPYWNYRGIY